MLTNTQQYELSSKLGWRCSIESAGHRLGTVAELAEAFRADPDDMRAVLDHLAANDWVERIEADPELFVVGLRFGHSRA